MQVTLTFFINIRNILNKKFENVCECFADNKLSLCFGEEKTKCILFSKEKMCRSLR